MDFFLKKKPHYPKDGSDDRIATSFKEQGKRAKRLAELDATMGQTDERISLLAKQWTNLDFTGGAFTWMATQWDLAEKLEGRRELRAAIFDATQMDRFDSAHEEIEQRFYVKKTMILYR
jgi:hypothetical protein